MRIVEVLQKDEELKQIKEEYKKKFSKNAPPYNYDQYNGIEDYKQKLKKLIDVF